MDTLLTIQYWFGLAPGRWQSFGMVVLAVGIGLIILFGISRFIAHTATQMPLRAVSRRLANFFLLFGIFDLVYWFFRDQNVPFFSARFWIGLMGIGAAFWFILIIRHAQEKVRQDKELAEHAEMFDKYLPRKK